MCVQHNHGMEWNGMAWHGLCQIRTIASDNR